MLRPADVEGAVRERERGRVGADEADAVGQAGVPRQRLRPLDERGGDVDARHVDAEALGQESRGAAEPGADVEDALSLPERGELGQLDRRLRAADVQLVLAGLPRPERGRLVVALDLLRAHDTRIARIACVDASSGASEMTVAGRSNRSSASRSGSARSVPSP